MVLRRSDAIWFALLLTAAAVWLCFEIVQPFLRTLFAAFFVAIAIYPFHIWLRRNVPGENRPALITTVVALLVIVLPTILFSTIAVEQGRALYATISEFITSGKIDDMLDKVRGSRFGRLGVEIPTSESLQGLVKTHGEGIGKVSLTAAGSLIGNILGMIVSLGMVIFFLFFFLRDGERLYRNLRIMMPLTLEQTDRLAEVVHSTMAANVYGILAVGVAQGAVTGLAFLLLGIPHGAFWAVVAGIASIFPLFGSAAVWIPGAIYLLLTGHVGGGIVLLIVGFALIANLDNVIRPLVIQDKVQMSTLAVLISLLGGVQAFGLLGLFAGPVILSLTGELFKILFEEITIWRQAGQEMPGSLK